MKVRAVAVASSEIPSSIEPYTRQTFVTVGKEYVVHAIAVLGSGVPFLQYIDDHGMPAWTPTLLFEPIDYSLPADWICNCFTGNDGWLALLLGPDFIAKDVPSYVAMVELEPEQVDRLRKRVEQD